MRRLPVGDRVRAGPGSARQRPGDLTVLACDLSVPACDPSAPECDLSVLACDLSAPACDLSVLACDLSAPACDLSAPACGLSAPACDLSAPACDPSAPACDLSVPACDLSVPVRDLSVPVRDLSVPVRDLSVLLHDLSVRLRGLAVRLRGLAVLLHGPSGLLHGLDALLLRGLLLRGLDVLLHDLSNAPPGPSLNATPGRGSRTLAHNSREPGRINAHGRNRGEATRSQSRGNNNIQGLQANGGDEDRAPVSAHSENALPRIEGNSRPEGKSMMPNRPSAIARAVWRPFAGFLGLVVACAPGSAQTGGDFYKGKQLSVMIGYGVGGSDDLWARLIAQRIGEYIPGRPTVVPINVPGAGSLLLANQITNTQPKDGTVIGLINRGIPFEPLLGGIGVRFDPLSLNFIGSPDRDTAVCATSKGAPVQTVKDLYEKELIVGATGSGADTEVYPNFLKNLLGMKFKVISGYPGSRDIILAIERGEVQGICVSYDTIARENIFKNGTVHVLFQAALKPDPRLNGVPFATDLAKTEKERQALDLFLARGNLGRPFIAPPGVPGDRLEILRTAFEQAVKNPTLVQEAEGAGLHPFYISSDELQGFIADAHKTPPDVVALTKKALGR